MSTAKPAKSAKSAKSAAVKRWPKIGSIAQLVSGSPPMTVEHVWRDRTVSLVWLDQGGHINFTVLPASCLKPAP